MQYEGADVGGNDESAGNPIPLPGVVVPIALPIPGAIDPAVLQQTTNAQQKAGEARDDFGRADAELDDLGAGTDPDYVSTIEHFEGMTHQAMYEAVHGRGGMDAAGLRTLQRAWFDSYSDLVNLSTFNLMGMNRIFGNGLWQGASGEAAQAASQRFSRAANQIGRVFDSVATRLDSLAWSAEAVRTAIQPPPASSVTPDPDNPAESILPGLINPEFDDQTRIAQEQARQAAIRALNSGYTPNFPPAGTGVPAYTNVPQIVGTGGPDAGLGANGANGPSSVGGNSQEDGTQTLDPIAATPGTESDTSATNPAGVSLPEGLLSGASNAPTGPASTAPAGLNPNMAPTAGSPGLGSGSNSLGPSGSGGSSAGSGGLSSGPGGPGFSRPGVSPVATGTQAAGTRGGTSTPAGRMGPMSPGAGARKKDDNEAEHFAPDYLRRVQPEWTEGLDSADGAIGADLVADHGVDLRAEHLRVHDMSPSSGVNSADIDPVESASPPVTLTGAGPMDSGADSPEPVESTPTPVMFAGVGPMDSHPDERAGK